MSLTSHLREALCTWLPSRKQCLYYWQPTHGENFGDELSLHIVNRLIRRHKAESASVERCQKRRCYSKRLLALGSILHEARSGDVIWGSGINGKVSSRSYDFSSMDFRAVRGPLTRELVKTKGGRCPEVFGDPGLLIPQLFPELKVDAKAEGICVIPNLNDAPVVEQVVAHRDDLKFISPTDDWKEVVRAIQSSQFVISSSLHGIVLSDAYGIACRPLRSLFEAPFKFEDYFLGTGRDAVDYARSIDHALELGPVEKMIFDSTPLLSAFPKEFFMEASNG